MEENFCQYSSGRGLLSKIWEEIKELNNKRVNNTISKRTVDSEEWNDVISWPSKEKREGMGSHNPLRGQVHDNQRISHLELPLKPPWPLDGTKPLTPEPSEDTQGPSCSSWMWVGASGHWDRAPGTEADGYRTYGPGTLGQMHCSVWAYHGLCSALEVLPLTDWVAEWNNWPLWLLTVPVRLGADEMRPARGAQHLWGFTGWLRVHSSFDACEPSLLSGWKSAKAYSSWAASGIKFCDSRKEQSCCWGFQSYFIFASASSILAV